ncbi:MAG: MerR family transcriptional regulator [Anaerolineae bacterium]|nr:MerR family transcriptional regulator [Anaerolineae bacterium]
MSEQTTFHAPQDMAGALDVSPTTLRRWSQRFGDFLSAEATGTDEGRSHRRYTDADLMTLQMIKELMNKGMTYEQVHQQLALQFAASQEKPVSTPPGPSDDDFFPHDFPMDEEAQERGLIASNGNEAAVAFLTNTLATLSESQKSILNSQAANRELMGVLIQDNFNLKEENNRLRERILDVERNLAQARQENEWQRETLRQELDAKIVSTQQLAIEAITTAQSMPAPDIKAVKSKPGCLGRLLGASGDIQVVSVPRPREKRADGRPMGVIPPSYSPSPSQPPPPFHPKPTRPPE